jgi:hypothetical protein
MRTCLDSENCGTISSKPKTALSCGGGDVVDGDEEIPQAEDTGKNFKYLIYFLIGFLVLIVVVIIIVLKKSHY